MNAADPYARLRDMLATKGAATTGEQPNGDKTGGSPSEQLLAHFKLLNEQLARSATTSDEVAKVFDVDSQLTKANQDLLQQARELPAPLDVWVAGVAADVGSLAVKSARSRIAELWTADSASLCSSIVTGRYPFDRASSRDVAIADFTRLFAPTGVFQSFFKQRMEPFVDKTTTPWSWKAPSAPPAFPAAPSPSSKMPTRFRAPFPEWQRDADGFDQCQTRLAHQCLQRGDAGNRRRAGRLLSWTDPGEIDYLALARKHGEPVAHRLPAGRLAAGEDRKRRLVALPAV